MGRRRSGRDIDGVVLLDKPTDISSNDALQKCGAFLMLIKLGIQGRLIR